jgi:hypothetical protein
MIWAFTTNCPEPSICQSPEVVIVPTFSDWVPAVRPVRMTEEGPESASTPESVAPITKPSREPLSWSNPWLYVVAPVESLSHSVAAGESAAAGEDHPTSAENPGDWAKKERLAAIKLAIRKRCELFMSRLLVEASCESVDANRKRRMKSTHSPSLK